LVSFVLAFVIVSGGNPELNLWLLQGAKFSVDPRTRFIPNYGFVVTRGWESEGQDQDSRVVYRSHCNEIELRPGLNRVGQ
jgi:hypothetical protein